MRPVMAAPADASTPALAPAISAPPGLDLAHRPVSAVKLEGLKQVSEQLVRNQIRIAPGAAYDAGIVEQDLLRITHLGRFASVRARVEPQPDGTLVLVYVLEEQPLIKEVRIAGNKELNRDDLLKEVGLTANDPADPYLIDQGRQRIVRAYERKGYHLIDVEVDQDLLSKERVLLYRVREGPFISVQEIQFEGNLAYSEDELYSHVKSRTRFWPFRQGELNKELLDADVATLRQYYFDQGYLEAQVGRQIDISPDQQDAVVRFVIREGPRFLVGQVRTEGNQLYTSDQIQQVLNLHAGEYYSGDSLRRSQQALIDLYGRLGYLNTKIDIDRVFREGEPVVDLLIRVDEGRAYTVGKVQVKGNIRTQDKVILRQIRGIEPGRRFDRNGIGITERRLRESSLFMDPRVTLLGDDTDEVRDVVVEVKEASTASVSFGAGISSDAGLLGAISVKQRNFDIADTPDSWGELWTGQAFRGAGQSFSLDLQPGNEVSRYAIGFRDPFVLDTDYFLSTNAYYFTRNRTDWDEDRAGLTVSVGQRIGDAWTVAVNSRVENVGINNLEPDAPLDAFAVAGSNLVTNLGLSVTRSSTDSNIFPTRGNRLTVGVSRTGALGGDFDFTRADAEFRKYWTVDEDFLGRKTVFSIRAETGYIFEDGAAPLFERLYAGGHRDLRGFSYRGIGPRGIRADTLTLGEEAVGGDFLLLLGAEYNYPLIEENIRGVVFVDTGTVDEDLSVSKFRVSVGTGLRLIVPLLGPTPIAIDFAFPLVKEDTDETQVFSFDIALPF